MLHLSLFSSVLRILIAEHASELTLCAAGITLLVAGYRWLETRSRAAVAVCLTCLVLLAVSVGGLHQRTVFSAAQWASVTPDKRHYMLDDLTRRHTLVGMTGGEVRTLLGRPDYTDTETLYAYVIDQPFDESTLDLTLENGVITAVSITLEH